MRLPCLLLLACSVSIAATVQGVIYDDETKSPLARTKVTLIPLPGAPGTTPATALSMLANDRGQYVFTGLTPGWYLLRTSRVGYALAEYGQSRPGLPGRPFEVTSATSGNDSSESRQIVMHRQAAITGTVVDDNSIGIPDWPVSVYTARQPVRRVAQGSTDDRGNFRIGELDPGSYIVRAGGGGLDDAVTTVLPAYYKYGTAIAAAEPVRVRIGETQSLITIHTVEGKLYELSGELTTPDKRSAKLTLITDTGRRLIATAAGPFSATSVPPGKIELLAEGPACAGYQRLALDRNMFARIDCVPLTPPVVTGNPGFPLIARRLDLDGPGSEITVGDAQVLFPGHWEFTVRPGPSHYLLSIQDAATAIDGWFALDIGNAPRLQVNLSARPASISGVVSSAAGPVIGAPVFLELINPDTPELPTQTWTERADAQGNFAFYGLPPGSYRLASSFDLESADPIARNKVTVTVREGDVVRQSLDLILP